MGLGLRGIFSSVVVTAMASGLLGPFTANANAQVRGASKTPRINALTTENIHPSAIAKTIRRAVRPEMIGIEHADTIWEVGAPDNALYDTKNMNTRVYLASLSKLPVMAILFDHIKAGIINIDDTIEVSADAAEATFSQRKSPVSVMTWGELIQRTFTNSNNNLPYFTATYLSALPQNAHLYEGTGFEPGTEKGFMEVQVKAFLKKIGADTGTELSTSTGLPGDETKRSDDKDNISNPHDIARIWDYILVEHADMSPHMRVLAMPYSKKLMVGNTFPVIEKGQFEASKTGYTHKGSQVVTAFSVIGPDGKLHRYGMVTLNHATGPARNAHALDLRTLGENLAVQKIEEQKKFMAELQAFIQAHTSSLENFSWIGEPVELAPPPPPPPLPSRPVIISETHTGSSQQYNDLEF